MPRVVPIALMFTAGFALFACDKPENRPAKPTPAKPTPAKQSPTSIPVPDPMKDLEDETDEAATTPVVATPTSPTGSTSQGANSTCAALNATPTRIWPSASPVSVASNGPFYFVSAIRRDTTAQLVIVRAQQGQLPTPIYTRPLADGAANIAATLSSLDPMHLLVALVTAHGRVRVARMSVDGSEFGLWTDIGEHADMRFPARVALDRDHVWVAWTSIGAPMHTQLAQLDRALALQTVTDITPNGAGASGATFIETDAATSIATVDAHQGISPVWLRAVSGDAPPEPRILTSLSSLPDVAELAIAQAGEHWLVGYAAIGRGATSAVGLVRVTGAQSSAPEPLASGEGYGGAHVALATDSSGAIFVVSAPLPTHGSEVRVRAVRGAAMSPAVVLANSASHITSLSASTATDRSLGVAFSDTSGAYITWARCN